MGCAWVGVYVRRVRVTDVAKCRRQGPYGRAALPFEGAIEMRAQCRIRTHLES